MGLLDKNGSLNIYFTSTWDSLIDNTHVKWILTDITQCTNFKNAQKMDSGVHFTNVQRIMPTEIAM